MNRAQRRTNGVHDPALQVCKQLGVRPDQPVWLCWMVRVEKTMEIKIHACSGRDVFGRTKAIVRQYAQEPHLFTERPDKSRPDNWLVQLLRLLESTSWAYETDLSATEGDS